MPTLAVLVDFDNVEPGITRTGAVNMAKLLVPLIPPSVLARHASVHVRLYGGWRSSGALTTGAQKLVPDLRAGSPTVIGRPGRNAGSAMRLTVELAEGPMGTATQLQETLARDRDLRKFRARRSWSECTRPGVGCGMSLHATLAHTTPCPVPGCASRLSHVLVRDEQKMVDTLLVADIAYQALALKATDVVVVSSDTDMWPGVLLAIRAGCNVVHLHTRTGWRTQRHLMATLGHAAMPLYTQLSV